jgi:hypothetical protein
MVGPILIDTRERIEALATEDGQYDLRCGRTDGRPVPAAGLQTGPPREPPLTPPSSMTRRCDATTHRFPATA